MEVVIDLKESSQPLRLEGVANTYTKGPLFCLYTPATNEVVKIPLANIWRIKETYRPQ